MGRILLLGCGLLAGCVPYGERIARTCESLGETRGTPEFRDCVRQQVDVDQAERARWGGMVGVGAAIASPPAPTYYNSSCSWVGGTQYCSGVAR